VAGFPPRARIAAIAAGTASVVATLVAVAVFSGDVGNGGMATPTPTVGDRTTTTTDIETVDPSTGVTATPPTTSPVPEDPRQEELDRQRRMLRAGTIAYRAPEPMRVGEAQRVTVRVTDGSEPPDTSGLPGTGSLTVDPAPVGPDVRAALTGPDFDIERVGDDDGRRFLPTGGHVEWAWDVRPQRSGRLQLDVTLYVLLSDGSAPIEVRTYDRSVDVDVDTWREVRGWLKEWLPYTGLTVPVLAGGIWALVRRRRTAKRAVRRPPPRRTGLRSGSRRG
jgi:hypothetical protein